MYQLPSTRIGIGAYGEEAIDGTSERTQQLLAVERMNKCVAELRQHFRRQLVITPAVARLQAAQPARQRQRLVAEGADPVLRLPPPTTLDAETRAHGVVHRQTERVLGRWRLRKRSLLRTAEEQLELWPTRAEIHFGRERQADLQAAWQEKHAVDAR